MSRDTDLPPQNQWVQRSDAYRSKEVRSFYDLLDIIEGTYRVYSKLYETIGPWNAKQVSSTSTFPYSAPSREYIMMAIKNKPRFLGDLVFNAMINATIRFCETNKGKRQLITPHPSSHHSAHFPEGTFKIRKITENFPAINKTHNTHFKPSNIAEITLDGVQHPIYIENIRDKPIKYIIVRPKLGKLGTANVENWEVLLYSKNFGFHIEHVDSNLNPRYSGIV
jgi:hypothetical protein